MKMGAKVSDAMVKARKLVTEEGHTPYSAAKACGLTRFAIYMAPWYKEWKLAQQTRNCKEYPR